MDLHHHQHHHHTNANPNLNPNLNPDPNPNPNLNPNRSEAERLLGIAEKLLQTRDLTGSREFALLAQETEPLLEGSDQILAITDVLLASDTRVVNNRHHDWYSILQTNPQSLSSDPDLLKKNYRRLALLLHPDKNRYPLADSAFKLVADAWAVLSDPSKKGLYDHELNVYSKVELRPGPHLHTTTPPGGNSEKDKLPVRRSPRAGGVGGLDSSDPPPTAPAHHTAPRHNNSNSNRKQQRGSGAGASASRMSNFWTACPYCYVLYEYPRAYEECCLRCQNCERAFHATVINSLPPMVPGKEAYYCCWGFFPLGFSLESSNTTKGKKKVDGNNNGNNNVNPGNNNNNDNNGPNHNNNNNASQNPNSGFPNWMPVGMLGTPVSSAAPSQGGGGGANMNMNMNMNMNASVGGVDISDGSASAGFVFNNNNVSTGFGNVGQGLGNSTPSKKRGRPRKNPFPV